MPSVALRSPASKPASRPATSNSKKVERTSANKRATSAVSRLGYQRQKTVARRRPQWGEAERSPLERRLGAAQPLFEAGETHALVHRSELREADEIDQRHRLAWRQAQGEAFDHAFHAGVDRRIDAPHEDDLDQACRRAELGAKLAQRRRPLIAVVAPKVRAGTAQAQKRAAFHHQHAQRPRDGGPAQRQPITVVPGVTHAVQKKTLIEDGHITRP